QAGQIAMLAAIVPHDDDSCIRSSGEGGGFLYCRGNRVWWMMPAKAQLGTNQHNTGTWVGSALLWSVGGILDAQRVWLACYKLYRHRLCLQGDTRIVNEELAIEEQASCPQVGQCQCVIIGRRHGDVSRPAHGHSIIEILR